MSINKLSKLAKLRREFGDRYQKERLTKLGFQDDLEEYHAPVVEASKSIEKSAEMNTDRIINKIDEKGTTATNSFKENIEELKNSII